LIAGLFVPLRMLLTPKLKENRWHTRECDEIESLRKRGKSDEEIASVIQQNSSIEITAQQIAENYASPEERPQHGE